MICFIFLSLLHILRDQLLKQGEIEQFLGEKWIGVNDSLCEFLWNDELNIKIVFLFVWEMNEVVESAEKSCESRQRQRPEIGIAGVKTNVEAGVFFEFSESDEGVKKPYSEVLQG